MFQFTLRFHKKAALCCITGLLALAAFALGLAAAKPAAVDVDVPGEAEADAVVERHLVFLASCGWRVSSQPPAVETVDIPLAFGDVYERYNRLQTAQGFDLAPYKGCTVKKYVYGILSYPGERDGSVRANVLEYGGRVIGGDISAVRIDGFMHGFRGETDGYDPS